jgi:hypothetical protein
VEPRPRAGRDRQPEPIGTLKLRGGRYDGKAVMRSAPPRAKGGNPEKRAERYAVRLPPEGVGDSDDPRADLWARNGAPFKAYLCSV